ncbi:MAG: transposase [Caldilineaceae bacterium SB0662_bin_25]|nr:transposase [Caldilineaceae bacterium SB0662_bin_25]
MTHDPEIHRRRSIRLGGFDYSSAGAYFITVVVQGGLCLFGVVDGEMRLSGAGEMVRRVWEGMAERFPHVVMDEFVVMPNHVHGVVFLRQMAQATDASTGETARDVPKLGDVVREFKSLTTVEYGKGVRGLGWERLWQRNYYERVIRNESELRAVREYIVNNPRNWELDRENPGGGGGG